MGQWNERQGRSEQRYVRMRHVSIECNNYSLLLVRMKMYEDISNLIADGKLLPPACELVGLEDYRKVLDNTLKGFLPAKYVFKF